MTAWRTLPPALRAAAAVLVAVALVATGMVLQQGRAVAAPDADSVEAGFVRDMSDHHAQAVDLSFLLRDRTTDPALDYLAFDIATTQQAQVGMMRGWLEEWGVPRSRPAGRAAMDWMGEGHLLPDGRMPGMASGDEIAALERASGPDAEVRWLRLMTTHHLAGVDMAQAALDRSGEPRVRRLAAGILAAQRSEVDYMADLLAQRGVRADVPADAHAGPHAEPGAGDATPPGHAGHG